MINNPPDEGGDITKEEYLHILNLCRNKITLEELKTKQTITNPGYVASIVQSAMNLGHAVIIDKATLTIETTYEGDQYLAMN